MGVSLSGHALIHYMCSKIPFFSKMWLFATAIHLFFGVGGLLLATSCRCLCRLPIHGAAAEEIGVASDVLVAEVKEQRWIQCHTTEAGFKWR